MDRTVALMMPLQYWLGQRVQMECRLAYPDEVKHARIREEDDERAPQPETQEAKFIRMMEDMHKLAVNPNGDALMIPTFSGAAHQSRMKPHLNSGYMKSEPRPDSQSQQ